MTPCADCGSTDDRDHDHVCAHCLQQRQSSIAESRAAKAPFMPRRRMPSSYVWASDSDKTLMSRARARAEAHIAAVLRHP